MANRWTWSPSGWPVISISVFAPLILLIITAVLCRGIKETRLANNVLTLTKIGKDWLCLPLWLWL